MVLYLAVEEEEELVGAVTSGLSILGLESVGDAVTPSSELLRLADPGLFVLFVGIVLQTESSDRDRPINRDTLPCRAASINVPLFWCFIFPTQIRDTCKW